MNSKDSTKSFYHVIALLRKLSIAVHVACFRSFQSCQSIGFPSAPKIKGVVYCGNFWPHLYHEFISGAVGVPCRSFFNASREPTHTQWLPNRNHMKNEEYNVEFLHPIGSANYPSITKCTLINMTFSISSESRFGVGSSSCSGMDSFQATKRRVREWEMETENSNNVTSDNGNMFLPVTPNERSGFSLNVDLSSVRQQQDQRPPGLPLSSRQNDDFAVITQSSDSEMEMNEEEEYQEEEEAGYVHRDMFRFTSSSLALARERERRRKKCRMGNYVFTASSCTPSRPRALSATTQVPWWKRKDDSTAASIRTCTVNSHRSSTKTGSDVSSPSLVSSCRCHVCQETIPLHEHSCVGIPATSSTSLCGDSVHEKKEQSLSHAFASDSRQGGTMGTKPVKKNSLLDYFSKSSKPSSSTKCANSNTLESSSVTSYAPTTRDTIQRSTNTAITPSMTRNLEQCAYCDKMTCASCLQHCEGCGNGISAPRYCTFCSTIDYQGIEERVFCSTCFEVSQDRDRDHLRGYSSSSRHGEEMDCS